MITPRQPADERLLRRFVLDDDDEAFAELVRRHGGLVRGVCRQVLGAAGDLDDAAQSTFLSLARNAPLLSTRMPAGTSLSGWLYRVAVNAALQQRRSSKSRRRRETRVIRERGGPRDDEAAIQVETREALSVLHEELRDLPRRFRGPVMLCHLEGRTQKEAASELGLSYGTLRRRLDQGRRLLRARLERRGVAVSTIGLILLSRSDALADTTCGEAFVESVVQGVGDAGSGLVTFVAPRTATVPSAPTTATIWSCAGKAPTMFVTKWLLATVLAGVALPPAVSALASDIWGASESQPSSVPLVPAVPYESHGHYDAR